MPISDFYAKLVKSLPVKGQELLNNSRSFNLYIRNYSKLLFHWPPEITVSTHLVELKDRIYDFRIGELSLVDNWGLTSCGSHWLYCRTVTSRWRDLGVSNVHNIGLNIKEKQKL